MKITQDIAVILILIIVLWCAFVLFIAGFFGFKVLDFIENCMESDNESDQIR